MVIGTTFAPTEFMSEKDTLDAFSDGLKKSASAARELAKECLNEEWESIAQTLDSMCFGGRQLANMKSMSRLETLMAASIKANPKGFIH